MGVANDSCAAGGEMCDFFYPVFLFRLLKPVLNFSLRHGDCAEFPIILLQPGVFLRNGSSRTSPALWDAEGWGQEGDKDHEYFIEHERDQTEVIRRSSAEPINIT